MGKIFQRVRKRKDETTYVEDTYTLKYYNPARGFTVEERTGLKATGEGTTNYRKAEKLLRERESAKDHGAQIVPAWNRTTMDELFDAVLADYANNEQRSLDKQERIIRKHLKPVFGGRKAISVTAAHLESYKAARRQEGASKATVNRELSTLRKGFYIGVRTKKVSRDSMPDFHGIMLDESDNVRENFFELDEYLRLRLHLPEYAQSIGDMAYAYGQRKEELLSMQWTQVSRVDCIITLPPAKTKNKKLRRIYYGKNAEIRDLIESQWKSKLEIEASRRVKITHVFFHADGRRVKSFRGAWETACKESGIARMFHDLRRTAVRNMIRAGISEKTAMLISGHSTRSVFDRYAIVSAGDLEIAGGKVGTRAQIECNTTNGRDVNDEDSAVYGPLSRTELPQ